jgi:tRNA (cmo5U34)-methyltransferase
MTERFDGEGARAYDSRIPLLVPGYELLHQLCASRLMAALGQQARVLLVGVGTGSELLLLGRICPRWTFVAQDISADMLAQARMRAEQAGMGERVRWHLGPLPVADMPCDGALCLLVLHFLPLSQKAALLGEIARQLVPGAPLLLADLMAPTDPLERKAMGLQAALAGLPPPACEQMVRRLGEDFVTLDEGQTRHLLQGADFTAAHRFFQALGFHGWLAQRR